MIEGDETSNRFLPRIRQELDKLPLTDERKDTISHRLLKDGKFLDTHGGKVIFGGLQPDSSIFNFADKVQAVVCRFQNDGLTANDYLNAVIRRPDILTVSPEVIARNVSGVVDLFTADGMTTKEYLQAALKQPSLFVQTPETLTGNITGVVERFAAEGLTDRRYLDAALKQPSLFTMSPETVARHIDAVLYFSDRGMFSPPTSPRKESQRLRPSQSPSRTAVIDFLLKSPAYMCLADDNYGLREIHQRLTDGPTDSRMLTRSRYIVEEELMQHFGHDDPEQPVPTDGFIAGASPPSEEQARRFVLRALIHAGFIRSGTMER